MQVFSFDLFMWTMRPALIIILSLLSGIYIDAFRSESADGRESHRSVAEDLIGIVHDRFNRNDIKVRQRISSVPGQ